MLLTSGWNFAPLPEEPPDDLTEELAGELAASLPANGLLPALDPWACPTCGGNPCRYRCFEED